MGTAPAPVVLSGGSEDPGGGAPVDPAGAMKVDEPVDVGMDTVDGPVPLFGLSLLFLEEMTPPATPPAMAPIKMIPPISMKTLHFF